MGSLKDQLFQQYAAAGLNRLLAAYRKQYLPKKGDRFNHNGITYEIGPPKVSNGTIEFEVSSKIPQGELLPGVSLNDYFDAVRDRIGRETPKAPDSIDMANIVRDKREDRNGERGYVRLKYSYREDELYTEQDLQEELRRIQEGQGRYQLPPIPEVTTLAGRLVLVFIQDHIYQGARDSMEVLIEANEAVRQALCDSKLSGKEV
ncbi:MAG: hypothetical protein HYY20_07275 [Candidatus Tectomicrobia bacterium]|uniref:Uncharacterized protein n=1 Tax=Tectimicrobiota bacterium TaxID=2528274 RepID=A0A932CPF2_UNCTE|nr:hypothetical protein [Candidatus Tectomicrobia bacterium]